MVDIDDNGRVREEQDNSGCLWTLVDVAVFTAISIVGGLYALYLILVKPIKLLFTRRDGDDKK